MSKAEAAANAKAAEKSRAASAAAAPKHSSASKHKVGGGAVVAISLQLAGKSRKFFSSDPTAIGRVTHALASALSVLPSAVQLVQVRCGSRVANSCLITPPLYLVLGVMPSWQSHLRSTNTPSYYHPRCADHCCRRHVCGGVCATTQACRGRPRHDDRCGAAGASARPGRHRGQIVARQSTFHLFRDIVVVLIRSTQFVYHAGRHNRRAWPEAQMAGQERPCRHTTDADEMDGSNSNRPAPGENVTLYLLPAQTCLL